MTNSTHLAIECCGNLLEIIHPVPASPLVQFVSPGDRLHHILSLVVFLAMASIGCEPFSAPVRELPAQVLSSQMVAYKATNTISRSGSFPPRFCRGSVTSSKCSSILLSKFEATGINSLPVQQKSRPHSKTWTLTHNTQELNRSVDVQLRWDSPPP